MTDNTVIVGAGQAGVAAAFKLRALGYPGAITLVGEEAAHPYHRPPLSKRYLADPAAGVSIPLKHVDLYEKERIALVLGCRVATIDRSDKTVALSDGRTLAYDHLILATGATPRALPPELGGRAHNVHVFRTLADADRLRQSIAPGRKLLIVGGGYIGLETAAVARGLGMAVTLIERDARILGRVASAETATYFRTLHQDNGVQVIEGAALARFGMEADRVVLAELADGTRIDTDIVVVGIGVVPATGLAAQAGLAVENGIVVDQDCRSSDPAIFAAGDCASFPYEARQIRIESVQNAVAMAERAAQSIAAGVTTPHNTAGEVAISRPVPWFWSDQYATKLQIAGLNTGHTHVVVRRSSASAVSVWYYRNDRFLAVDAINDARAFMTAKRWLAAGQAPNPDAIADPTVAIDAVPVAAWLDPINATVE